METYYICYYNNIGGYHTRLVFQMKCSSYGEAESWFDGENRRSGMKLELAFITTSSLKQEQFRRGQ